MSGLPGGAGLRLQRAFATLPAISRPIMLLAIAALLPLILFGGFVSLLSVRQERASIEQEELGLARRLSYLVDRELMAQVALLRSIAALPLLDGSPDLAAFSVAARRLKEQNPLWFLLLLADGTGTRIADTDNSPPLPIVDQESLRRLLDSGEPVIGNIRRGSNGIPAFAIRVPVSRDGAVRYALTAVLGQNALQQLVATAGLPSGWRAAVLDQAGNIVAGSADQPELVGRPGRDESLEMHRRGGEGLYRVATYDGQDLAAAYRVSPETGWSVHVGLPRTDYEGPLRRATWLVTLGGGIALALAALFLLLLVRHLALRRGQRLHAEQQLRMESLGRLTGGVAHDFNNLLMVILGNLETIERRAGDSPFQRQLGAMRRAAERGAQLTRELLAFGRGGTAQAVAIDLDERLRSFLAMLHHSLRADIAVELDLAPDLPPVVLDPIQLDLALLNIAVNARDAMPDGGVLRIATRRATLPEQPGQAAVMLVIADSGAGIRAEALPHVFEPFFTTKPAGRGTGLGLSQVYGFAKQAGGTAEISSTLGSGTTVTLYFPAGRDADREAEMRRDATPAPAVETGRLLLIDDVAEVRTVTAEFLEQAGYHVRQTADASEGLALLAAERFDLVVSDIVMPGALDGIALAREVRRRWPNLPVLLVTGYSDSAASGKLDGFTVLAKPFRLAELDKAIRTLLAGNPRSDSKTRGPEM